MAAFGTEKLNVSCRVAPRNRGATFGTFDGQRGTDQRDLPRQHRLRLDPSAGQAVWRSASVIRTSVRSLMFVGWQRASWAQSGLTFILSVRQSCPKRVAP